MALLAFIILQIGETCCPSKNKEDSCLGIIVKHTVSLYPTKVEMRILKTLICVMVYKIMSD